MSDNSTLLLRNVEEFIRKYFRIKLFQGLLMAMLLLLSLFLIINFIEYFSFLPGFIRKWIFYGYILILAIVLFFAILIPLWRLMAYRKQMDLAVAAKIIGRHFSGIVDDKLLNTLQLMDELKKDGVQADLLAAAIKQRSDQLAVLPFNQAVKLGKLKKIAKAGLMPSIVFIGLIAFSPRTIKEPVNRIVSYKTEFEKPLSFQVNILNNSLEVVQNEDYILEIDCNGTEIPNAFALYFEGSQYPMEKMDNNRHRFTFKKVNSDKNFYLTGGEYKSKNFTLTVRPKALLLHYEARLKYPNYMNRPEETLQDFVYANLPAGTQIGWKIFVRNTDQLLVKTEESSTALKPEKGIVQFNSTALNTSDILIFPTNAYFEDTEGLHIRIEVLPDEHPGIRVEKLNDKTLSRWHYFSGEINDDYGFTSLKAILKPDLEEGKTKQKEISQTIEISENKLRQSFYFSVNMDSLIKLEKANWTILFDVADNDWVRGPKHAVSSAFRLLYASEKLLDSVVKNTEVKLDAQLNKALKEAANLKKDVAQFNKQLLQKKETDWNDKQTLKQLLDRQMKLEEQIMNLKNERQQLNEFRKDNEVLSERLLEKQQQIDELLDKVIPEDIQKMMEELQQMLENINKDQMSEMLKKMEFSQQEMEKMLDRNLSLLKQLEVEKHMNEMIEHLKQLADELEKNAEETQKAGKQKDELNKKLQEISQQFEKESENLEELKDKNQDLEKPFSLDSTKELEDEIEKDLEDAQNQMDKNRKQQSGKSQKSASGKMSQMAMQLQAMMQQSEEDQLEEDAVALRYLLESLIRLSIDQEAIFKSLNSLWRDDPLFVERIKEQADIIGTFQVLDDSLVALAKRQSAVKNFVFEETAKVKQQIGKAQNAMKDRNTGIAVTAQQYAMTSMNNLALMLAESLKNMEENMGMPSEGQGQGKGKGKGQSKSKSLQNMRELQEALGKQLKEAMDGKNPVGKKSGMSEGLARMAAQQEALRNELKKLMDQMKSEGQAGDGGLNKVLKDMEKFEESLVSKNINNKMLELNQEIVTRLLQSEKAQKEREQEERRESNEYQGKTFGNFEAIPEYKKAIEKQNSQLRLNPLDLKPYYKRISNDYLLKSK